MLSRSAQDDLQAVRRAIEIERDALSAMLDRVDDSVCQAVETLAGCRGRIIVTGIGKAGHVARKIAATLSSTGAPAFFLHPTEAIHGDLGVLAAEDVLMVISNSGESPEIVALLPHFKRFGVAVVCLTGKINSTLAKHANVVLDVSAPQEADPLDLAPTASTTTAMAMGDALAVALLKRRGFTREQFAIFHPGGSLGKKLLWTVNDLMHHGDELPTANLSASVADAVVLMSGKSLGCVFSVDDQSKLLGVFTDGDLRRLLESNREPLQLRLEDVMSHNPRSIHDGALAAEALRKMEDFAITVLPVLGEDRRLLGALHLHDLLKAGLA